MRLYFTYVVGLTFCALAIYFSDPAYNKSGACALIGLGLIIPALVKAVIDTSKDL